MSLVTLVHYAQTCFEAPSSTLADQPSDGHADPLLDELGHATRPPARAPVPAWLRRRPSDSLIVGGDHGWRIDGEVGIPLPNPDLDAVGPDALGFYAPFHMYRDEWGIYIRDAGVKYLAPFLKGASLLPGDEHFLSLAQSAIVRHELWHAATEIACTRAEMLARQPLYRSYFEHREGALHEEALANAYAFWWTRSVEKAQSAQVDNLAQWMDRQGPGYRDFQRWVSRDKYTRGRSLAVTYMTEGLPNPKPRASGYPYSFLFNGALDYPSMPVRHVVDAAAADGSVVRAFPREHGLQLLVYSRDHDPPHFHIKLLGNDRETRYLWPELKPYEGDPPLTGGDAKSFRKYWDRHQHDIESRLLSVFPQSQACRNR